MIIFITTFAAIAATLVCAIYVRRLFDVDSTLQAFMLIGMVAAIGTVDVLWFIPTVVRYFLP